MMASRIRGPGWFPLEGLLALRAPLHEVLFLHNHSQSIKAVPDLLQGVLRSQMTSEWVITSQMHYGTNLQMTDYQEVAGLSLMVAVIVEWPVLDLEECHG